MKQYIYILLSICSILLFNNQVSGQRVASGQAFAQIVDGTSITSNTVNALSVNSLDKSANIDLGKLTVKTGSSTSCEIVIKPATLTNSAGESLTLETSAIDFLHHANNSSSTNRTLALTGNTTTIKGETGIYQGSYTIILAFN